MMITTMTKKPHTAIALNAEGLTMRLTMNINLVQNADGMPIKKLGEKQENPRKQITKWEMRTFSQGVGTKCLPTCLVYA